MIVSFTGHRPDKLNNEYNLDGPISKKLFAAISKILDELKPKECIVGMAIGVDQLAALVALDKKISLVAAIPFLGQEKAWPKSSQELYNEILSKCKDAIIVCDGAYANWKMQKRNEWMVDNSDVVIAVWDGSSGGTKNCYDYAEKKKKKIIRINPKEL